MITLTVSGDKALAKALKDLEKKIATKILREELRTTAKEALAIIKPSVPVGTGFLRRSLTVRAVKKKKRYTFAYRIFARSPKEKRYYAFAPEYGVRKGKGKQPARHFMKAGISQAKALIGPTQQRIWKRIEAEWRK